MDKEKLYKELGICKEVYDFGEKILESLKGRFEEIDSNAELNQLKVISAMQKNKVNATHFMATTPRSPIAESLILFHFLSNPS